MWTSNGNGGMTPRRPDRDASFHTIGQVAERYQTTKRTVGRWIKAGDQVVHRFGGLVRIYQKDLDMFEKLHRCS